MDNTVSKKEQNTSIAPQKPFMVKAYFEWLLHNGLNAKFNILASGFNVSVPSSLINKESGICTIDMNPNLISDFQFVNGTKFSYSYNFKDKWVKVEFPAELVVEIFLEDSNKNKTSLDMNYFESDLEEFKYTPIKVSQGCPEEARSKFKLVH